MDHDEVRATVYAHPEYIESLATAKPVREVVEVDLELRGCPVDPGQLREVLTALLAGRRPQIREEAVCMECKRKSLACVLVVGGQACLGPVTQAGCGAICPSMGRGCYGCFGPKEMANAKGLAAGLVHRGRTREEVGQLFAGINAWAEPFRAVVADAGGPETNEGRHARCTVVTLRPRPSSTTSTSVTSPASRARASLKLRLRDGDRDRGAPLDLRGAALLRAPRRRADGDELLDIVARICGICPIAYQMTAVHAFESLYGVEIDPEVRALRRLLYAGEWIQSHALHVYLLHAPDFLGYPSALAMAADHKEVVERGLRLKKIGNAIMAILGGRAIHPVSVRIGGFSKAPRVEQLEAIRPELDRAIEDAQATIDMVAGFPTPGPRSRHPSRRPQPPDRLPVQRGPDRQHRRPGPAPRRLGRGVPRGAPRGHERAPRPDRRRRDVPPRTGGADHPVRRAAPPARGRRPPAGPAWPGRSGRTSTARSSPAPSSCCRPAPTPATSSTPTTGRPNRTSPYEPRAGRAAWSTEAPRGLIFHRYEVDERGLVREAQIVPPTSQNQGSIEADLRGFAPSVLALPHDEATLRLEQLIRSYDPCISCATHFLDLSIEDES